MSWARPYISITRRQTIKHMNIVNDHIANILQGNASISRYLNIGSTTIDSLVAIDNQLVLKLDLHIGLEDDPEGLILDDSMAKGPRGGFHRVVIGGVGDDIEAAPFATHRVLAKPNGAIG